MRGLSIKSDSGMALVVVLLVTALLVAIIGELVYGVHLHASIAASFKDSQKASALASGGVDLAGAGLRELFKDSGHTILAPEFSQMVVPEGDGVLRVRIEDEQGKLSLNSLVYSNGELNTDNYDRYVRLLGHLGLDTTLADTLVDWIDINDLPMARGAETYDHYRALCTGCAAKNAQLLTVEEALLVKGYTPEAIVALKPYVTVHTDGMININGAQKELIMALSDDITEEMADRVIAYRNSTPFTDDSDIIKVQGFDSVGYALQGKIGVKSTVFRVYTRGASGEGIKEAEAVIELAAGKKLYYRER